MPKLNTITKGDALETMRSWPDRIVQTVITSPPYWGLRDYGIEGQLGLEKTPEKYVTQMVEVFREVRRVLRDDGTLWLILGDSYNAHPGQRKTTDKVGLKQATNKGSNTIGSRSVPTLKPKDLVGIPWRMAFALQDDGWYLRQDNIWEKPNCMPESVLDRTTRAHEYIFHLAKSPRYYYDSNSIKEPNSKRTGQRNCRTVWSIHTQPCREAHFATFPEKLVNRCVLAGSQEGDTIFDPFAGSGTVALVALKSKRNYLGIELNPDYVALAEKRIRKCLREIDTKRTGTR